MNPDILRGEPNNPYALLPQPSCPARIVRDPVWMLVALPIHFDRQLRGGAVEVQNVRSDRMLSAKLQTCQSFPAKADP